MPSGRSADTIVARVGWKPDAGRSVDECDGMAGMLDAMLQFEFSMGSAAVVTGCQKAKGQPSTADGGVHVPTTLHSSWSL